MHQDGCSNPRTCQQTPASQLRDRREPWGQNDYTRPAFHVFLPRVSYQRAAAHLRVESRDDELSGGGPGVTPQTRPQPGPTMGLCAQDSCRAGFPSPGCYLPISGPWVPLPLPLGLLGKFVKRVVTSIASDTIRHRLVTLSLCPQMGFSVLTTVP